MKFSPNVPYLLRELNYTPTKIVQMIGAIDTTKCVSIHKVVTTPLLLVVPKSPKLTILPSDTLSAEECAVPLMPSQDVIRNRAWQISLGVVLGVVAFAFAGVLFELGTLWVTKADYSHGLVIVPFIGYLLWSRRDQFPAKIHWPDVYGLPFFLLGAGLFVAAGRVNIAKEWFQPLALLACLLGVVVMFCGRWKGLVWAGPGLAFLPLAFQLPFSVEQKLSLKLQNIATEGGNFVFQTLGLASYNEGNIIIIGETKLGVAEACSGLSMLLAFFALSAAIAILYKSRPVIDRVIVFLSSIPIALLCNVIRITVTGLVYHAGWTKLGDLVVHDLAGWLMMPLALGFTWFELKVMNWVVEPVERLSTEEALGLPIRRHTASSVPPTGPVPFARPDSVTAP